MDWEQYFFAGVKKFFDSCEELRLEQILIMFIWFAALDFMNDHVWTNVFHGDQDEAGTLPVYELYNGNWVFTILVVIVTVVVIPVVGFGVYCIFTDMMWDDAIKMELSTK